MTALVSRSSRMLFALVLCPLLLGATDPFDTRIGPLAEFSLQDHEGKTWTRDDLSGKVRVVSFLLAGCPDGKCPQVAQTVQKMRTKFAGRSDVVFLTFVLDENLTAADARKRYDKDPDDGALWLFLSGDRATLNRIRKSLFISTQKTPDTEHDDRLFVVDRHDQLRGLAEEGRSPQISFRGLPPQEDASSLEREMYQRDQRRLRRHIETLTQPELPAFMPHDFPRFNAMLNAFAGALVLLGYRAIRRKHVRLHALCMLSAIAVSTFFLASYLFYHLYVKEGRPTRFADQAPDAPGWVAILYAAILLSHTILAVPTAPLALWAAVQGLRGKIQQHVRLVRWVLPVWVYVSITGVVVYWMLYRMYPE